LPYFDYAILIAAALLGGLVQFFLRPARKMQFEVILSFSGAYLFGITVLHLIPEAFHNGNHTLGAYILLGFFIQLLLEQLTRGVEHGHIHAPAHASNAYAWGVFIGLSIHAFVEGIPLGAELRLTGAHQPLLYGIALHKIPAAFALVALLTYARVHHKAVLMLLFFFSLMTPAGAFLPLFLKTWDVHLLQHHHAVVIAIVIGMFFHVSTTILFETSTKIHKFSLHKIGAIISGAGLALLTVSFGH